jgi:hypothetical protein
LASIKVRVLDEVIFVETLQVGRIPSGKPLGSIIVRTS